MCCVFTYASINDCAYADLYYDYISGEDVNEIFKFGKNIPVRYINAIKFSSKSKKKR